tara:strand:+ start:1479 stop:1757 length:279 start_codon:yes stop_codon:yes gene_type:complete
MTSKKQPHPLIGKPCVLVPTEGCYQKDKPATVVGVTKTQIKVEAEGEVNIMGEPHPPRRFKRSDFYQFDRKHEFPRYKLTFNDPTLTELAQA